MRNREQQKKNLKEKVKEVLNSQPVRMVTYAVCVVGALFALSGFMKVLAYTINSYKALVRAIST